MATKNDIPEGVYCYDQNGVCPFYRSKKNKEGDIKAFCQFLNKSSDDYHLLEDQVKECHVNTPTDDFD